MKLSRKRPDFEKTKNGSKAPGLKHYIGPGPQDLAQYYLPRKWGLDWMLQILVQNVVSHSVWPLIWYTICGHTIQNQIKWGRKHLFLDNTCEPEAVSEWLQDTKKTPNFSTLTKVLGWNVWQSSEWPEAPTITQWPNQLILVSFHYFDAPRAPRGV